MHSGMALQSFGRTEYTGSRTDLYAAHTNGFLGSRSLGTRWANGTHMEDNELEEGEACDDPDSNCDPDTAFSYIDEKLRVVLGDVQKEFEGGVSAEKLGSKFGGYGSFLPTHERAPSLLSQPIPAMDVSRARKSPSEGVVERIKRIAASSTTGIITDKAGNGPEPLSAEEGSKYLGLTNAMKSAGDSASAVLKNDSKKFTLRIKLGSEADMRRKNTAIYSGLGLEHSSSASLEDDLEDDQRSVSEIESSPDRSPLAMIRIMTSHELPGGVLLSPLPDLVLEPFDYKGKVASPVKAGHKMTLPVICKVEAAPEPFPLKNEIEFSKDIGIPIERRERTKDKTKEKTNKRKDEAEAGNDNSKRSKRDDTERGNGKKNGQSVLKLPGKVSGKETLKLIATPPERVDKDAVSESGKGTKSGNEAQKFSEATLERVDKDAVSESGNGVKLYDTSRESIRGAVKVKGSSSECIKSEVKNEPVDRGSPFVTFKEVEFSRDSSKGARGDREFFEETTKEHFNALNQVRDTGKDSGSSDIVVHGRKQKEVSKDWSKEGLKSTQRKEATLARKERALIEKEALSHRSKDNGTVQTPEFETSGAERELAREATGDMKRKHKTTVKDGRLAREPSKDKVKDNSAEVWKDTRKDTNAKELLSKEIVSDTAREGHKDRTKVRESHKEVAQQMAMARMDGIESRKKEKLKEGKKFDLSARDSLKYEKDREREQTLVKDHAGKATDHLPSESRTEATMSDKRPQMGAVAGLPTGDAAQAPAVTAPVVILENWVACDKCEQWRLLPPGLQPEHLPSKWRCKMLHWLQGMNNCRFTEEQTTQALYAVLGIPQPPPQIQVDPAMGQIPPPTVPSIVPSSDPNTEAPKMDKPSSKKMRKVEPGSTKSKSLNDVGQLPQERKLVPGDDNVGYARVMEEKRIYKEKEKKRLRDGEDARPRKHLVQEDDRLQGSRLHYDGDSAQHGKGFSGVKKEGKHSKHAPINTKKSSAEREASDVQYQATSFHGDAEASIMPGDAEANMMPRAGPLNVSGTTSVGVGKVVQADHPSLSRSTWKQHNILPAVDSLNRVDGQQSSSGGSGGRFKGNRATEGAALDSWIGESSKQCKESGRGADDTLLGRALPNYGSNGFAGRDDIGVASPVRRDHGHTAVNNAMREAKDLKHRADRLKEKEGVERESTNLYFGAALKFLHAAAMLEPPHMEITKPGEITQSMIIYTDTAKLCEYCAISYERAKELAAAALAYKCVGIALMRVVSAKSASMNRDREELQGAFQLVPHGESSSSSSASDVDNLNNHAHHLDKLHLSSTKGAASPSVPAQTAGNYVIPSRFRPNYGRLLHFVSDVTAALEAFDKSQAVYAAADAGSASTHDGREGMVAVKSVVDFGFYDIESLLRLVRLALEAIGH